MNKLEDNITCNPLRGFQNILLVAQCPVGDLMKAVQALLGQIEILLTMKE